ncbi:MAG: membrane protein of unknown function [Nitrospira sp.]|nr:MAG: membrane protein of unknown function [Nitrospira sp.]
MVKVRVFSCLAAGLKALRPNLFSSFIFVLLVSAVSTIPIFIDRMQGLKYPTLPISPWGFFNALIGWTAQTLIMVGVGQVVWRGFKNEPTEFVHLFPGKKVRPQIIYWSISLTVIMFGVLMGSALLTQSGSKSGRFIPLPMLPLLFYFLAFIPLMIVDRQLTMWMAITQGLSSIKVNFFTVLKLTLTAEAVLLIFFALLGNVSEGLIQDTFSMPESVVIDEVFWLFCETAMWVINSAMMAVAYVEIHGLSAGKHHRSENQIVEGG